MVKMLQKTQTNSLPNPIFISTYAFTCTLGMNVFGDKHLFNTWGNMCLPHVATVPGKSFSKLDRDSVFRKPPAS